jgi:hypothetical protein
LHAFSSGHVVTDAFASNIALAPNGGFWVQTDRGTAAVNGAPQFNNVPFGGNIVSFPGQNGYWVITNLQNKTVRFTLAAVRR